MSFWSKLFGGKPRTIDDEIMAAGKAAGLPRDIIETSIKQTEAMGMKKEMLLQSYLDRAKR